MFIYTQIGWGTPVAICSGIAHVKAYIEHLDATYAFNLRVQYGRERAWAISKLPAELNTMIMDQAGPSFEAHRQRWLRLLECHENKCQPSKRYSEQEVLDAGHGISGCAHSENVCTALG